MKNICKIFILFLVIAFCFNSIPVQASSHREAPFITELPKVDGTDFYLFNSYESGRSDFVTIVANYQPLQQAYGGPNFFSLDPEALYEVHIDNSGDAVEDITFQFRAMNTLRDIALDIGGEMVSVPFINVGGIGPNIADNMSTNVIETYEVRVIRGDRRKGKASTVTNADSGESTFVKPTDNIGDKSIPNYEAYAKKHIYNVNVPGCSSPGKIFVGQRQEGFAVDLGGTFDLVNFNPLGDPKGGASEIADNNVTTFAIEVPKSCLVGDSAVVGAWTTSSLPKARIFSKRLQSFEKAALEKGAFVQVSRLSAPLINELIIGLKDKNKFNFSEPKDDGQFATYVTHPTLPAILELLFSSAGYKAPTAFPRTDLVAAFLTGVEGLNKNTAVAEMLRLNTSIPAVSSSEQDNLGVIAGDNAGFPNGRRPGDDVVDIELRVASGVLLPEEDALAGQLELTDGAFVDASDFDQIFPYLKSPVAGKLAATP
ncbi:MAG: DUF4331 domain-containing protein [Candidatus Melainabacteria bacterium]|nr:DUF4331 domain-containing protein [Candidatus Melainabacteria bacterium]